MMLEEYLSKLHEEVGELRVRLASQALSFDFGKCQFLNGSGAAVNPGVKEIGLVFQYSVDPVMFGGPLLNSADVQIQLFGYAFEGAVMSQIEVAHEALEGVQGFSGNGSELEG